MLAKGKKIEFEEVDKKTIKKIPEKKNKIKFTAILLIVIVIASGYFIYKQRQEIALQEKKLLEIEIRKKITELKWEKEQKEKELEKGRCILPKGFECLDYYWDTADDSLNIKIKNNLGADASLFSIGIRKEKYCAVDGKSITGEKEQRLNNGEIKTFKFSSLAYSLKFRGWEHCFFPDENGVIKGTLHVESVIGGRHNSQDFDFHLNTNVGGLYKDTDNDGLTDVDETKLGTDLNNRDTDDDNILDGYDTNPKGGGEYIIRNLNWKYKGSWSKKLLIHSDIYDYYKNFYTYAKKRVDEHPYDVTARIDYSVFKDLADYIKKISQDEGYNSFEMAEMAMSLIQQLPYSFRIENISVCGDKFPIEVLYYETGCCIEFSKLAASLLEVLGYDVVILSFPALLLKREPFEMWPGHAAIGFFCSDCDGTYYVFEGKRYYYWETTNTMDIGYWPFKEIEKQEPDKIFRYQTN